MASIRNVSRPFRQLLASPSSRQTLRVCLRWASTEAAAGQTSSASKPVLSDLLDLEQESTLAERGPVRYPKFIRPTDRARRRKYGLPGSRYQYHPPKYDKGPLHPIQSPPSSDPVARDFIPGPFYLPRLKQTYESTLASDIMTLAYQHRPPGTPEGEGQRLRGWDGSSPYHKNRPLRAPRGRPSLPLAEKPIAFNNIPEIREVTVAAYAPRAARDKSHLIVAQVAVQCITGVTPEKTWMRKDVPNWGARRGKRAGVKATMKGHAAYEFLDRCIHLVFPRIKDWKGVKGTTGDSSGNLSWGMTPDDVSLFPELEVNHFMYPAKMLPGLRVFVKTTAKSDRHARLLLQTLGVPFYGEIRN